MDKGPRTKKKDQGQKLTFVVRLSSREAVIFSTVPIAPNHQNIAQHPQRIVEAHAAFRHVVPVNGHFDNLVTAFAGDVEHFNIKAHPAELLHPEEVFGNLIPKTLEAALRIFKTRQRKKLDEVAEDAPLEVAIDRFIVTMRAERFS